MPDNLKSPCETCQQVCPTKGCKLWRDWWIANWNRNICRKELRRRETWQYEHPDMGREGE